MNRKWFSLRYLYYRATARLRHGPQCATCDRREICAIIRAGSRPCDPRPHAAIWDMRQNSFAHHVNWFNVDTGRVYGFFLGVGDRPRPKDGDIILAPMESGKIGRFAMYDVRIPHDPGDQFFASTQWLGYHNG